MKMVFEVEKVERWRCGGRVRLVETGAGAHDSVLVLEPYSLHSMEPGKRYVVEVTEEKTRKA